MSFALWFSFKLFTGPDCSVKQLDSSSGKSSGVAGGRGGGGASTGGVHAGGDGTNKGEIGAGSGGFEDDSVMGIGVDMSVLFFMSFDFEILGRSRGSDAFGSNNFVVGFVKSMVDNSQGRRIEDFSMSTFKPALLFSLSRTRRQTVSQ